VGLSILLFWLFPPKFDLRIATIIQVAIVGAFLAAMERPVRTAATNVAPLTAIMSASGIVFGAWTIVLAALSGGLLQWRILRRSAEFPTQVAISKIIAQMCVSIAAAYAVIGTWSGMEKAIAHLPHAFNSVAALFAILLVGLAWQTVSNFFVYVYQRIMRRSFALTQFFRIGIVASVYAYLLVAMYRFGGLLAATIFYVVVAQIKVVQDVLGITTQLHKLEKAQVQAEGLVRDLLHLTDTEEVEFSSEVQNIAQMIGRRLGMSKSDLESLGLAAQLHEMGKARLPARIRTAGRLTDRERAQKARYARWGALMIRASDAILPVRIADSIEFHGEHFDGTGYPRGLRGEDIPIESRIISVARDYVRYLTGYDGAERVGKEKALSLLRDGSGTLYDPRIVSLLNELVS
jgi:hypothetical protein